MTSVFMGWGGGIGLLNNFVEAIRLDDSFQIIFLVPKDLGGIQSVVSAKDKNKIVFKYALKKIIKHDEHLKLNKKDRANLKNVKKLFDHTNDDSFIMYDNSPSALVYTCKDNKIDVLFPVCGSLGKHFPLAWVGYIWDLQHLDMPEFFTKEGIEQRNTLFQSIINDARSVVVNAKDVKDKVVKKYGGRGKVDYPPFSPAAEKKWFAENSINKNLKKYHLKNNYFICSNQLWMHKDHPTMFRALAILPDKKAHLVLTGLLEDHRNPNYRNELEQLAEALKISHRIHWLGYIPKDDQMALMRGAIATIQPTLYEGGPGGGSAANSIALGKPVILSDITVNKEIKDELAIFFKAGNAKDLARQMQYQIDHPMKPKNPEELIKKGNQYKIAQSKKLVEIIKKAMV